MSIEARLSGPGALPGAVSTPAEPRPQAAPAVRPFTEVLQQLGRSLDGGERLVQRALSGAGGLDAGQLIALQAGIYRYTEAVDLAAKLVDRASTAVRTTLQSSGG
jgi:hypothetical protein